MNFKLIGASIACGVCLLGNPAGIARDEPPLCLAGLVETGPNKFQIDIVIHDQKQVISLMNVEGEHVHFFTDDIPPCSGVNRPFYIDNSRGYFWTATPHSSLGNYSES